jgi:hypothetical protein
MALGSPQAVFLLIVFIYIVGKETGMAPGSLNVISLVDFLYLWKGVGNGASSFLLIFSNYLVRKETGMALGNPT